MRITIAILLVFWTTVAISFAEESRTDKAQEELDKYNQTGELKRCVSNFMIRRTQVLDDSNILFEMKNGKYYLNTLDRKCNQLGFDKSFAYSVSGGRLCDNDLITVFSAFRNSGPICALNKFEILEKKEISDS